MAAAQTGRAVTRAYDASKRITAMSFPDGVGNQTWSYTPDGMVASITTHNSLSGTQVYNAYAYNKRRLLGGQGESITQPGWYTSQAVTGQATATYGYRGRACNASGCSGYSATDTVAVTRAPAAAPTLSAPSSTSTGDFTVSWTTVAEATTYTLEEESPLTSTGWAAIQSSASTAMAQTNKVAGTWQYRVKACNSVGCGAYSATVSVTSTVVTPPPVPTGLTAVPNGVGCSLSWNASPGATYYELKKSFVLYSGPNNFYEHDAACPTPRHVRACNATICSAWSP